jgi:hypothetical protein
MQPPITRDAVYRAIYEHGPMTAQEIADTTGIKRGKINGALNKAPLGLFYISAWRRQDPGTKGSVSPIYAIGPGRDKPHPGRIDHKERCARYRERNKAIIRVRDTQRKNPAKLANPFHQLLVLSSL